MRRWIAGASLLVAVACGVAVYLWGGSAPPALEPAPPMGAHEHEEPAAAPSFLAAPVAGGALLGQVVRGGRPVAGARVRARGGTLVELESGADGTFAFGALAAGDYVVSAVLGGESSPVEGPLSVGTAGPVRVTLELLAGATVSGVVVDALRRQPIAGATVRGPSGEVKTDRVGRFTLAALPASETWLEALAPGYLKRLEWLAVGGAREHGGLEISLRPAGIVRGRVVRLGQPLAGATVWGEGLALGAEGRAFGPVASGDGGHFELWVEGGAVQLAAAGPGGGRVEGPRVRVADGALVEGLVVELGQPLAVQGTVVVGGVPEAGVALLLIDARSQKLAGSAVSQAQGRFVFAGVVPGSYLVQASRGALVQQRGPFELTGDGDDWRVELSGGRVLAGRVVPAQAGVRVQWRSSDWAGPQAAVALTDAAGVFRFEGVPDGRLAVDAQGPAGSASATARAGDEVVLRLAPSVLSGRVVNERSSPVTDFTVRLRPLRGGPTRSFATLSASGDFRVQVAPGDYEVTASAPGYGAVQSAVVVTVGERTSEVQLVLVSTPPLRAKVIDAVTSAPLGGVEVVFNRMTPDGRRLGGRWATLVTGADGELELGAAPRDALVLLRKEGYQPYWLRLDPAKPPSEVLLLALRAGRADLPPGAADYEGIGAQLQQTQAGVVVAAVFEGSPAEVAGLLAQDRVVAVDGRPTAGQGLPQIISQIMGPSGTLVRLTVERQGQALEVSIRRRTIQF